MSPPRCGKCGSRGMERYCGRCARNDWWIPISPEIWNVFESECLAALRVPNRLYGAELLPNGDCV